MDPVHRRTTNLSEFSAGLNDSFRTTPANRAPSGVGRVPAEPQPSRLASTALSHPSVIAAAAATTSESQIQNRLDQFRHAMQGPYRIGNQRVVVPATFRMNGGLNQLEPHVYLARIKLALPTDVFKQIAKDLGPVISGKGTPEQLRRVTQALIDSPVWSSFAPPPPEAGADPIRYQSELADSVRRLMWEHGLGADCSGYVHNAFLQSRNATSSKSAARYGLGDPLQSGLQSPPASVFRKLDPIQARAGDVFVLTNAADDGSGHKVIVYSHVLAKNGSAFDSALRQRLGDISGKRIHIFEVDSSWGAGGDPLRGGVERHTWGYDESSRRWLQLERGDHGWTATFSLKAGPYDHDLMGVYRPKAES